MSNVRLLHGDCREVLPTLDAASVDLAIVDPPYNVSNGKKDIDRRLWDSPSARRTSVIRQDFGDWDKFASPEEFYAFTRAWMAEVFRVLKPGATLYSFFPFDDISDLKHAGKAVGFKWLNAIAWRKLNPAPNFNNMSRYCHAVEAIGWFAKGKVSTFNGHGGLHNHIETALCQGDERTGHPTQKPLAVLEPLIQVSSNPGDVVLDCFAGSGSTLVAAKKLGRSFIGIEREERYFRLAQVRTRLREPDADDLALLNGVKESDFATLPLMQAISEAAQ